MSAAALLWYVSKAKISGRTRRDGGACPGPTRRSRRPLSPQQHSRHELHRHSPPAARPWMAHQARGRHRRVPVLYSEGAIRARWHGQRREGACGHTSPSSSGRRSILISADHQSSPPRRSGSSTGTKRIPTSRWPDPHARRRPGQVVPKGRSRDSAVPTTRSGSSRKDRLAEFVLPGGDPVAVDFPTSTGCSALGRRNVLIASKSKLFALVNIRYFWEMGARVKTEGQNLVVTATLPVPSLRLNLRGVRTRSKTGALKGIELWEFASGHHAPAAAWSPCWSSRLLRAALVSRRARTRRRGRLQQRPPPRRPRQIRQYPPRPTRQFPTRHRRMTPCRKPCVFWRTSRLPVTSTRWSSGATFAWP